MFSASFSSLGRKHRRRSSAQAVWGTSVQHQPWAPRAASGQSYKDTSPKRLTHAHTQCRSWTHHTLCWGGFGVKKVVCCQFFTFCKSLLLMSALNFRNVVHSYPLAQLWKKRTFARLCNKEFGTKCDCKPRLHEMVRIESWHCVLNTRFNSIHQNNKRRRIRDWYFGSSCLFRDSRCCQNSTLSDLFSSVFWWRGMFKFYSCNWSNEPRLLPDNWWFSSSSFFMTLPLPRCPFFLQITLWALSFIRSWRFFSCGVFTTAGFVSTPGLPFLQAPAVVQRSSAALCHPSLTWATLLWQL